jgi:hypothetical protein
MKPGSKPVPTPSPVVKRPASRSAARGANAILRLRRPEKSSHWKSLMIGGFGIAAIFVCLELTTKPAPTPGLGTAPSPEIISKGKTATLAERKADLIDDADTSVDTFVAHRAAAGDVDAGEMATVPGSVDPAVAGIAKSGLTGNEPLLVLTGLDANRRETLERDRQLFKQTIDEKDWDGYRNLLARSIDAGIDKLRPGQGVNRFDGIWKEPALYQALLRWQVLGHFSSSQIASLVTDSYSGEFLSWLCNTPSAMEELLMTIKPQDDGGKVLKFLIDAWPNTPGKMDKYFSLALACAVVFDREIAIPNPIGTSYGEKAVVEPLPRYLWFIEKNEKGKLAAPVHRTPAWELVWVVCAPVSTSELEWSLDKMHLSRSHWGNAYGMVEYLMERAVKGLNPYKEYSFSEILKEGGICGDQSYFCANTARAQGIPAMILAGETDLGGHAWVGMKTKGDEWTTEIGRIGGVSKGETGNPQTGGSLTEQEIWLWSDRAHQSPVTTLAVARHLWLASYYGDKKEDLSAAAVKLANQIGPSFTETWAALFDVLKRQMKMEGDPEQPSNLEEWKSFAKDMRRQYKDNPRMAQLAATAENEYIFPYGDEGDASRMLLRERRRINRDSAEQKDLIAESLKREADLIFKRGEPDAKKSISNLYDSALRKYGGSITGFKMMAEDYFGFFKDDPELSRKAARDIELAFKRVVETGTKEWFRAKTESDIYRMICGYYRTAGDSARAEMLEKRYEVLLRRAERGAL